MRSGVPIDVRVREAIIADLARGESKAVVAARYGVAVSTVARLKQVWRLTGSVAALPHAGGARPTLGPDDLAKLRALVAAEPTATVPILRDRLVAAGAPEVSVPTVRRALAKMGLKRRRLALEKERPPAPVRKPRIRQPPRPRRREEGEREPYPSDLNDEEWALIAPLLPAPSKEAGRPREIPLRELLDAMLYVLRTGCQWRALPHDFPYWKTVYTYFRLWRIAGHFEHINDVLRRRLRREGGRDEAASAWIVDSQTARTTETPGERGYEGGKRITGRKRTILVDTLGLLIAASVVPANIHDLPAGLALLNATAAPPPRVMYADTAYEGPQVRTWLTAHGGGELNIVRLPRREAYVDPSAPPTELPRFTVLPKRWIVERSFAWTSRNRRLTRDYEGCASTAKSWLFLAMVALMTHRMALQDY
jgi:putative transposase